MTESQDRNAEKGFKYSRFLTANFETVKIKLL